MIKKIEHRNYREYPAMNYSTLSAASKDPKSLIESKREETEAMIMGSLLDVILTRPSEVKDEFQIVSTELPKDTTTLGQLVETLFKMNDFSDEAIEAVLSIMGAKNKSGKLQLTLSQAIIDLVPYKELLTLKQEAALKGLKIISPSQFDKANILAGTFISHEFSSKFFTGKYETQVPLVFDNVFISDGLEDQEFKILVDIIWFDEDSKIAYPIDIKTSSKLWEFENSVKQYRYDIQKCLYTEGVERYIKEAYPGYLVAPFQFIVGSFQYPGKVLRFELANPTQREIKTVGWKDKFGTSFKSIYQILNDIKWHKDNGQFEYSKDLYINQGLKYIVL